MVVAGDEKAGAVTFVGDSPAIQLWFGGPMLIIASVLETKFVVLKSIYSLL